ncbi:Hypothetical protein KVN_LOCUS458 [uncultured virus]|nr:Hypothetical protein KVN_LOCUS458 [uncultured virus]
MRAFKKNGYLCVVRKDKNEAEEIYLERVNFVVSQKPKNEEEYNEAIKFSRLFVNVKYSRCEYDKQIMDKLQTLQNNIYT